MGRGGIIYGDCSIKSVAAATRGVGQHDNDEAKHNREGVVVQYLKVLKTLTLVSSSLKWQICNCDLAENENALKSI